MEQILQRIAELPSSSGSDRSDRSDSDRGSGSESEHGSGETFKSLSRDWSGDAGSLSGGCVDSEASGLLGRLNGEPTGGGLANT